MIVAYDLTRKAPPNAAQSTPTDLATFAQP
jgi:hypothetical protein